MDLAEDGIYKSVFHTSNTPMAIIRTDEPAYSIVALNEKFKQSTSTPVEEAIGKSVFEVYKPFDASSAAQFERLKKALDFASYSDTPVVLPTLHFSVPDPSGGPNIETWWQIELIPVR